ncbi:MAG TPA: MBL fold metallo-hydrolase [Gemmatimonadaceae bacterium]|nr:MBL fold metallo-hydrolase [Gemmatimonadaceae bacterium]
MKHLLSLFAIGAGATAIAHAPAAAQAAPTITLTRLDCGTNGPPTDVGLRFSDTYAYNGLKVQLTFSCYLVRHGDDYLVWDTGNPPGNTPTAPKTSLADLLAQLGIKLEQVKYVAVSHYHGDHTGQVSAFPAATLLIGKGDWRRSMTRSRVGRIPRRSPTGSAVAARSKRSRVTRTSSATGASSC